MSYINVFSTILHLPSAKERQKAFSTYSSYVIVVTSVLWQLYLHVHNAKTQQQAELELRDINSQYSSDPFTELHKQLEK